MTKQQHRETTSLGWRSPARVMLILLAAAGAAFGTTLATWISAQVTTVLGQQTLEISGADAAPAVSALALVAVAAAIALRIATPKVRYVIAAITVLAGIGMALSAVTVLGDPAAAVITQTSAATGTTDTSGDYSVSFFPWLALVAAILVSASGIWAAYASRNWPLKRKYERAAQAMDEDMDDIDTWDSLSEGNDPTDR